MLQVCQGRLGSSSCVELVVRTTLEVRERYERYVRLIVFTVVRSSATRWSSPEVRRVGVRTRSSSSGGTDRGIVGDVDVVGSSVDLVSSFQYIARIAGAASSGERAVCVLRLHLRSCVCRGDFVVILRLVVLAFIVR